MNMPLQMKKLLQDYMPLTVFVSVLFVMGIVFGALLVNALSLEQKQEMFRYVGSFFHSIDQGTEGSKTESFQHIFGMHLKWMLLIWVLGLSVIGLPLVLVLNFLKGVLVGFTVGFFVSQWSWKGMVFAMAAVAPQNIVIIPSFILSSVFAILFSIYLIRNRLMQKKGNISQAFMQYSIGVLALTGVLLLASLLEVFCSPYFIEWATPVLSLSGAN
ncbi:stage II sporulation protein M [Marinicrinis sediminis]|uniref:Stage II sporulation protein M n=1 Tax=Marinicrinis sediminis TaxID=1652465 RepID=A0ABW5REK0_9BACL